MNCHVPDAGCTRSALPPNLTAPGSHAPHSTEEDAEDLGGHRQGKRTQRQFPNTRLHEWSHVWLEPQKEGWTLLCGSGSPLEHVAHTAAPTTQSSACGILQLKGDKHIPLSAQIKRTRGPASTRLHRAPGLSPGPRGLGGALAPSLLVWMGLWARHSPVGGETKTAFASLSTGRQREELRSLSLIYPPCKTEALTIMSHHRVAKDYTSQEAEEEGKRERNDEN